MPVMGDPVADGLVINLARPGGNVTGMTFLGPELATKRLGLLTQALPAISRVAARRSRDKSEPLITEGVAAEPSLVHRSFARLRIASGMRRQ
jgi:ABC-type uncharacterized transport system substrate-binding protein